MINRSYFMSGHYYLVDDDQEARYEFSSLATYRSWFAPCLHDVYSSMMEPLEKKFNKRVAPNNFHRVKL